MNRPTSNTRASTAGDRPRRVLFISTVESDPWGGSEELWSRTAERLVGQGVEVAASVRGWPLPPPRITALAEAGVEIHPRRGALPLWLLAWRKLRRRPMARAIWLDDLGRCLRGFRPDLVVVSEGGNFPAVELMEFLARRVPFVFVSHGNRDEWWPEDEQAARLRQAVALARRCYFVSRGNLRLAERQLAEPMPHAAIVRNPCNVSSDARLAWPAADGRATLRLACVGKLDPRTKGQDLLLAALADPAWRLRDWQLHLFGSGPMRESLGRLAGRLGIADRVIFRGHVREVQAIWKECHVLVQPSRAEGLPLSVVEAMLCGRPVVATDVAGHAEVVEDGVTGFLADAATAPSLSRALERLWDNKSRLPEMGEAAASRIRRIMPRDPVGAFADEIVSLAAPARSGNPVAAEGALLAS